jgi:hypothetical protein
MELRKSLRASVKRHSDFPQAIEKSAVPKSLCNPGLATVRDMVAVRHDAVTEKKLS